jgi:hypothetical protein
MAEAKKKSKGKKLGPLPIWGWAAVGGGTFLVYYLYKRYESNSAAATTAAGNADESPEDLAPGTTSADGSVPTSNPITDSGSWIDAALAAGSALDPADLYNGIVAWGNGSCVSTAQYTAIGGLLPSLGAPPGVTGPLSVCSDPAAAAPPAGPQGPAGPAGPAAPGPVAPKAAATPTLPNLSTALAAEIHNAGQTVVDKVYNPKTGNFLILTNKGGVYVATKTGQQAPNAGNFFGSFLHLPAAERQATAPFTSIKVLANGGYTETNSKGQTYTFNPT